MKLKLHFLFLFTVLGLHAQKQIQPYNYSVTDPDKDKTETIMIYAAASSVNNLTFTLKNAKDEVLVNDEDKEISFQVFPFTEVSFGKHLTDAITSIKDNDAEKTYGIIKERITNVKNNPISQKQKIAVQDVRNIYQFFNALVITAFAYDTEPVAGVLKYSLNTTITKKNIEGFDADVYFTKRSKDLRNYIFNNEKENTKKENTKKGDTFLKDVIDNENSLKLFEDFYDNRKGRHKYKARVKFKHYAEKKLKELYNAYEIEKFIKGRIFSDYLLNKTELIKLNKKLDSLKASKTDIENSIKALKQTLEIDELKLNELKKFKDNLKFSEFEKNENNKLIDDIEKTINSYKNNLIKEENKKITDSIKINEIKQALVSFGERLNSYKHEKTNIENRINTLKNDQKSTNMIDIDKFDKNISERKHKLGTLNHDKSIKEEDIKKQNALIKIKQNQIDDCISFEKDGMKKFPLWNFEIESIEVDINDGFIEHITALGKVKLPVIDESLIRDVCQIPEGTEFTLKEMLENFYNERMVKEIFNNIIGKELKFENEFPIGFSSKSDFADLHKYTLYAFEGSEKIFSLPVTNVITLYVQRHQNDRLDFSPKDQVVSLPSDDFAKSNTVELKKETSSKILSLNIYSDFLGLKKANPNGLLQFEVEKNIPLWTKRMELGAGRSSNLGIVNYINFNLTWAKIGDEDRQLQVKYADRYVNNEYRPDRYVTFLDMIKYENTSVGADLNIASFDFPLLKARIELNAGIHYGRVNVVDTLATDVTKRFDKNVNLIRAYPDFILRIRPEERFGAYLRFRPFKTIVPNNEEFYTVSSEKDFVNEQKLTSKWLHRFELGTYYAPSPKGDNKFFFRYRYTNTSDWETNGYGEFQVGYLVYLKF